MFQDGTKSNVKNNQPIKNVNEGNKNETTIKKDNTDIKKDNIVKSNIIEPNKVKIHKVHLSGALDSIKEDNDNTKKPTNLRSSHLPMINKNSPIKKVLIKNTTSDNKPNNKLVMSHMINNNTAPKSNVTNNPNQIIIKSQINNNTDIKHNAQPINKNVIHQSHIPQNKTKTDNTKNIPKEEFILGLTNNKGENNCFINVIIQILYHSKKFREDILSMKQTSSNNPIIELKVYII